MITSGDDAMDIDITTTTIIPSTLDISTNAAHGTRKTLTSTKPSRGHEIHSKTIRDTPFSYICLELISSSSLPSSLTRSSSSPLQLDNLTVRSYITSALVQFLGLTGSAISIDILKVEGRECWVRVPREGLSPLIAAVGGWVGGSGAGAGGMEERVGWRVRGSGNWLSALLAQQDEARIWKD